MFCEPQVQDTATKLAACLRDLHQGSGNKASR
jgi:hypothetical protein